MPYFQFDQYVINKKVFENLVSFRRAWKAAKETMHSISVCSLIGAKIPRLPPVDQNDILLHGTLWLSAYESRWHKVGFMYLSSAMCVYKPLPEWYPCFKQTDGIRGISTWTAFSWPESYPENYIDTYPFPPSARFSPVFCCFSCTYYSINRQKYLVAQYFSDWSANIN